MSSCQKTDVILDRSILPPPPSSYNYTMVPLPPVANSTGVAENQQLPEQTDGTAQENTVASTVKSHGYAKVHKPNGVSNRAPDIPATVNESSHTAL